MFRKTAITCGTLEKIDQWQPRKAGIEILTRLSKKSLGLVRVFKAESGNFIIIFLFHKASLKSSAHGQKVLFFVDFKSFGLLHLLHFFFALIQVLKKHYLSRHNKAQEVIKIPLASENRSLCCSSSHYEIQLHGRKSHGMKVLGTSWSLCNCRSALIPRHFFPSWQAKFGAPRVTVLPFQDI